MNDKMFRESVQYVVDRVNDGTENKMMKQPRHLDAKSFNESLAFMEENLTDLYVRIRMIQNISDYTKDFLATEVHKQKEELWDLLKTTETTRDSLKRKGYIEREVTLRERSDYAKKDRDGTEIRGAVIANKAIVIASAEIAHVEIDKLGHESNQVAFKTNNQDLLQGKASRSFYMLDGPAKNGVAEKFTIYFKNAPRDVTNVDIITANCDIASIQLKDAAGTTEIDPKLKAGFQRIAATGASFTVVDKTYRQVTYEYDADRISSDFWKKVGEKEYAHETGQEYTFDLEKESGLAKYKEEFAAYQTALKAWQAEKDAVDERNRQRMAGYR